MGDDELDELQSPGYDSEAPLANTGSAYLPLHYVHQTGGNEVRVAG